MKKSMVIMAITLAALVVIYLIYDLIKPKMTSPCESIFQQTAVQLTSSLKVLQQTGGVSVGGQKIQDLSEAAQVVALNLKTCCIMNVNGQISADEFLKCQQMGEVYTKQVNEFAGNVNDLENAKQKGDSALLNQKLATINSQLDGIQQSVNDIKQHAEAVKEAHPNAATKILPAKKNTNEDGPAPTETDLNGKINLLLGRNGGHLVQGPGDSWKATIDSNENDFNIFCSNDEGDCEAVYGFKNDQKATFNIFRTLVNSTNDYNIKQFQLWYGDDLSTGAFDSIGTFTTVNAKRFEAPYQEFKFHEVTAKYLKVKLISSYNGSQYRTAAEFQLWGTLK
jgi:hypothetical protein